MREPVMAFVRRAVAEHEPKAPVLEVGSFDVNGTVRPIFEDINPYIGIDIRAGPGVDKTLDICEAMVGDFEEPFQTVVMAETLEHVERPWEAFQHINHLLADAEGGRPGGLFIGTWVFDFPIHDYPSDYFRATPEGFRSILQWAGFRVLNVGAEGGPEWDPVGVFAVARKERKVWP